MKLSTKNRLLIIIILYNTIHIINKCKRLPEKTNTGRKFHCFVSACVRRKPPGLKKIHPLPFGIPGTWIEGGIFLIWCGFKKAWDKKKRILSEKVKTERILFQKLYLTDCQILRPDKSAGIRRSINHTGRRGRGSELTDVFIKSVRHEKIVSRVRLTRCGCIPQVLLACCLTLPLCNGKG